MATALRLIRCCEMPYKERVAWRFDVWLEDNHRFVRRDGHIAAYARMLPSLGVLGRSGVGRGFGRPECGSSLASRTFGYYARGRLLSSLSGDEVPSAAEQDCTFPVGASGGAGCFSVVLSPSAGGLASGHFQPATSSSWAVVSLHSHARELRTT